MLARLALVVLFAACTPRPLRIAAADARIGRVGAFDVRRPDAPRFAWPATGLVVRFGGTALRAELTDTPNPDDTPATDWLAVVVDGGPPRALALTEGRAWYALAQGLAPGEHTVRVLKRTEPEVGTVALHGLELAPGSELLAPPAAPARHLRVVGDSISAGYGVEGEDARCHFSARSEDATRTYAAVASALLEARLTASAWSGKGVLANYEARDVETMPELWARTIPTEPDSPPLTAGRVDALVVHLGTNDYFRALPDASALLARFRALLADAERHENGAPTVLILSPMLADDYPRPNARSHLRSVLGQLVAEAPNRRSLLEQYIDPVEGVGCDFHPNVRTHERLGRELAAHLAARLR